jgi:flagellin-like hook-associated protein FlgL
MTSIGTLGRLSADAAQLRGRLDVLTRQAADGRRDERYGDIASEARRAVDLRAGIARREAYGATIERALGRTAAAQGALGRIATIAQDFLTKATGLNGTNAAQTAAVAQAARQAMAQVAGLLNETHEGEYLFAGSDSANPPIADPQGIASGGMATQIAAAVAGLGGGNAAAVAAATKAAAMDDTAGITPFSAFLSDPATGGAEAPHAVPAADGARRSRGGGHGRDADAAAGDADAARGELPRDRLARRPDARAILPLIGPPR